MGASIVSRPAGWAGAKSPMIYHFLRSDWSFGSTNDNGGSAQVVITALDLTGIVNVGDSVYVEDTNGVYTGLYTVTASSWSGSEHLITIDAPYVSDQSGFINDFNAKPNYRFSVDLWDADDVETIFENSVEFSPASNGRGKIDVQYILNAMRPEMAELVVTEMGSIRDAIKSRRYYITYKEVWTGSSEPTIDDFAQVRFSIYCAARARSANDVTTLTSRIYWLELFNRPKLFADRYLTMTYFNVAAGNCIVADRYKNGVYQTTNIVGANLYVNRVRIKPVGDEDSIEVYIAPKVSEVLPPDTDWTDDAGSTSKNGTSLGITGAGGTPTSSISHQDVTIPQDKTVRMRVSLSRLITTDFAFIFRLIDAGMNALDEVTFTEVGSNLLVELTATGADATQLQLEMQMNNGNVLAIMQANVQPHTNILSAGLAISDIITLDVVDPCERAVTLGWMNELGGDEWFTFKFNQAYGFTYQNEKATRVTVFAENLTLNEFEVINQMNSIGEVYRPAIPEFDGTQLGDKKRIGQQVYVILSTGALLEVIVIPADSRTLTKQNSHSVEITFELPDGYKVEDLF